MREKTREEWNAISHPKSDDSFTGATVDWLAWGQSAFFRHAMVRHPLR